MPRFLNKIPASETAIKIAREAEQDADGRCWGGVNAGYRCVLPRGHYRGFDGGDPSPHVTAHSASPSMALAPRVGTFSASKAPRARTGTSWMLTRCWQP